MYVAYPPGRTATVALVSTHTIGTFDRFATRDAGLVETARMKQPQEFWVYVIELAPEYRPDDPRQAVYVGETAQTPEIRFEKHKSGGRTAVRAVRDHGVRLRTDLAPKSAFLSRKSALRAEAKTAEALRRRGFLVKGGQGQPFMKRLTGTL